MEGCQASPDGVVVAYLHPAIPLLWRGGRRSPTGWLRHFCTKQFPSCGGVAGEARRGGVEPLAPSNSSNRSGNSPPVEGWQAQPDGVVYNRLALICYGIIKCRTLF